VGGQGEPSEHGGENEFAARPRPQEAEVLQAGPPDAEVEDSHLSHVADPGRNPPGQGGSWKPSLLVPLAHRHLVSRRKAVGYHRNHPKNTSIIVRLDARSA
jgi:hypothetical protein